jgi:hypothetical protein
VRVIESEKFDISSRNLGNGTKYFLKVKIAFCCRSVYIEKKEKTFRRRKRFFYF